MSISPKNLRELATSTRRSLLLNNFEEVNIPPYDLNTVKPEKVRAPVNNFISTFASALSAQILSSQKGTRAIQEIKATLHNYAITGKTSAPIYIIAPYEIKRPENSKFSECKAKWLTNGAKKVWKFCVSHKLKPEIILFHSEAPITSHFLIICNW